MTKIQNNLSFVLHPSSFLGFTFALFKDNPTISCSCAMAAVVAHFSGSFRCPNDGKGLRGKNRIEFIHP